MVHVDGKIVITVVFKILSYQSSVLLLLLMDCGIGCFHPPRST